MVPPTGSFIPAVVPHCPVKHIVLLLQVETGSEEDYITQDHGLDDLCDPDDLFDPEDPLDADKSERTTLNESIDSAIETATCSSDSAGDRSLHEVSGFIDSIIYLFPLSLPPSIFSFHLLLPSVFLLVLSFFSLLLSFLHFNTIPSCFLPNSFLPSFLR